MMQKYSDEELVAKYKESLEHPFLTELFTRHSGVLYRSALRTTKNSSNAEDVLQTAFIKMITDLPNYKGTGSVIGWMLQVVIHTCYEKLRSEKSRLNRERKVMSERIQTTDSKNDELKEMIENHLNKLPEIYKVPITLKIMEGLSIKEVSDALEIPEKTIRSQIDRGLEKLKVSLQSVGITASVISIGDMLQAIQKPLTPEVFTNSQYFVGLFQKKSSLSAKIATTSGKGPLNLYLIPISILFTLVTSVIIGWNYLIKAPALNTKTTMQQKWNFENTSEIFEYSNLGLLSGAISIVDSIGVNNSNVLKIEEDSIIEIDISKYKLPIKISYSTDIKINTDKPDQKVGFNQFVYKNSYKSDQKILKISGIRGDYSNFSSGRNSNAKLNYFGKWFSFMGYIDEESISFYIEGQRSYYLKGASHDNKKIYLLLKADSIIDDLVIESIDKSDLLDNRDYEKVCANIKLSKEVEYYDIEKEKLGIANSSHVKPYLRVIRPDFFSLTKGTDNVTIYPSLSASNKVEWANNKKRISKKWDFDNDQELEYFKLIKGSFFDGKSLGLNQSNCLGFEANSVVEVDISMFKLPLKVTYSFDFVIPGGAAGRKSSKGFSVLKGNYQKDRNILDFIKFKPTRTIIIPEKDKNINTKLGFVGEWVINTIYVSDDCLDFYFNGNRTSIKLGKSIDNKKLYFVLLDKYLIDSFTIESIELDSVPDISKFKKFAENFPFEKGSRGYFELEKETAPLNLEKNSLVKLGVFDSETAEYLLGLTRNLNTNVPLPDVTEVIDQR